MVSDSTFATMVESYSTTGRLIRIVTRVTSCKAAPSQVLQSIFHCFTQECVSPSSLLYTEAETRVSCYQKIVMRYDALTS